MYVCSNAPQRLETMRLQAAAGTVAQPLLKQEHEFINECYVVSDTMQVAKY